MKKIITALTSSLLFMSFLSACSQDKIDTPVKDFSTAETNVKIEELTHYEQEELNRLEQGILLVGESVKGGYYGTSVEDAYVGSNKKSIIADFSISNVNDKTIGVSEIVYILKDKTDGKSYIGKVTSHNPSNIQIKPSGMIKLKIAFEVPAVSDEYMFFMESSLDPVESHWLINNLTTK